MPQSSPAVLSVSSWLFSCSCLSSSSLCSTLSSASLFPLFWRISLSRSGEMSCLNTHLETLSAIPPETDKSKRWMYLKLLTRLWPGSVFEWVVAVVPDSHTPKKNAAIRGKLWSISSRHWIHGEKKSIKTRRNWGENSDTVHLNTFMKWGKTKKRNMTSKKWTHTAWSLPELIFLYLCLPPTMF